MTKPVPHRFSPRRLLYRSAQKVFGVSCFHVEWLHRRDLRVPSHGTLDAEFRYLTADDVRRFSGDPSLDLPVDMAVRLDGSHNACFGALASGRLASYVWLAFGGIEPEHCCMVGMSFPDHTAYLYKTFTHPDFRGRRLNGLTTATALDHLAPRGVERLVCIIQWTNIASLRSNRRLGFTPAGKLFTIGFRHPRWFLASRQAGPLGLAFGPAATASAARQFATA
jgi:RimJ/RimL family protein N-acetyltransferase